MTEMCSDKCPFETNCEGPCVRPDMRLIVVDPEISINPWQPIETAPKQGLNAIDLWINGRRIVNCRWSKSQGCWKTVTGGKWYIGAEYWMPIPPNPK